MIRLSNVITIDNPSKELLRWCTKNLRLRNPEYDTKLRMHFWVGKTPEYLYLYEIHGDKLVLPYGVLRDIIPMINTEDIVPVFPLPENIDYGCHVPLYDYQEKAVEEVYWKQYGILESAAGSGKTQMGIALIAKHGTRALWLSHTIDLLQQSKQRAEQYMDKSLLGTITGGKVNIGKGITFATVQTMSNLDLTQYRDMWDVVIVDECHRVAGSPTTVTQFSKVLNSLAARHKYGLTATVHRADGMIHATFAMLGNVVYRVPQEAVQDKIMKVGICPIPTGIRSSRACLNPDGTLHYTKAISYLCDNEERTNLIALKLVENMGHPSLILSDRLDHLSSIMEALPVSMRDRAVMVSGNMTSKQGKAEREQAIADMRTGRKLYLFATYSLAKEGLDIPCLERLYLASPKKDYAVITQSIGRIARTHKNKQEPICYDFVDDIPHMIKAYNKRCTTYRKIGCYFVEESNKQ